MLRNPTFRQGPAFSQDAYTWSMTAAFLLPLMWLLLQGRFTLLVFLAVLAAFSVVSLINRSLAICLLLTYLFLLGDIRRVVSMFAGFPKLDPLLLVGPIVTILFAVPLLLRLRLKDSLSKVMLALTVVMLLEIVNPRQGPITVGVAGAMFYVVPVLWFWIGREYGTDQLLEILIYKIVIPLAVLESLLGLWQIYVGFLPWEQAWITNLGSNYHALRLGAGIIRAFGFSVNSVEYANLLLIATTSVLAAFFAGRRAYALFLPLLGSVLFLASSRAAIVKLLFSVAAAWALSSKGGKGWVLRLPLALAVLVGLLAFSLSRVSSGGNKGEQQTASSASTEHQTEGLEHPFDSKKSTAGVHATLFLGGFKDGITAPLGSGLGAVTMATKRLGGDDSANGSTEVDMSDAFVSMGIVGGLLYLYAIYLTLREAVKFGRTAPKYLGLPALGILAAMGGTWIAQGQYAIGPLVWFLIGMLSRNGNRDSWPRRPRPAMELTNAGN